MIKFKKSWFFRVSIILLIVLVVVMLFAVYYYEPEGSSFLLVYGVNESTAQQGIIINLTEQDFKEHTVLAEVIKGEENFERLFRRDGLIADYKEAETIRNKFSSNKTKQRYVEYKGKYYEITIAVS